MKNNSSFLFTCNKPILFLMFNMSLLISMLIFSNAIAAEHCSNDFYIDKTLPNGARWDMCWDHRQREGIIFHHVYYTPSKGKRRMVLNHAAVAQIHVPYDDSGARFHDVSDYGIGHSNHQHAVEIEGDPSIVGVLLGIDNHHSSMLDLTKKDCLNGNLLKWTDVNVLCQQIESSDVASKAGDYSSRGNNLSLFSVSEVGAYFYIPTWRFFDDGTIEPWMGATGALQRFGSDKDRGWKMGDGRVGVAHLHNFFWKLDFDLNETSENDVVEEINFLLVEGKRQRTFTQFDRETARKVSPDNMRRWRVRDNVAKNSNNHSISYDIVLNETGHQDIGPEHEPFTHNDFYVTKQNDDERFASHNPKGGKNLAEFTNNENLINQDIVIWVGVTFYHMPRSEDAPHMDAHWSHMQLIPRDWHASNPLGKSKKINTSPQLIPPENQTSVEKNLISLSVKASDADNDELVYSATGLPIGLIINEGTGLISGILTRAGEYTVEVVVSDEKDSKKHEFNWVVIGVNKPPLLNIFEDQTGLIGDSVMLPVLASDGDNDQLNYTATGLPLGLTINSTSGVISGSLSTAGNYSINLKVSDDESADTRSFTWVVIRVNKPPLLNIFEDQSGFIGDNVEIPVLASDSDNDPLNYTATGLPPGLTINSTSGVISGSLSTAGNYIINLKVSDDENADTKSFTWLVSKRNTLPVAVAQQVSVKSGASVSVILNAIDVDNDSLNYEIKSQPTHGSLSGTPPNLIYVGDENYTGSDSFTFKASDGSGDSSAVTISLIVTPINDKSGADEPEGSDEIVKSEEIVVSSEIVASTDDSAQPSVTSQEVVSVSNEAINETSTQTSKSGGGLFPLEWIVLLSFMSLLRLRSRTYTRINS